MTGRAPTLARTLFDAIPKKETLTLEETADVYPIIDQVMALGELLVEAGLQPQLAVRVLISGALGFGDLHGVPRVIGVAMCQKLPKFTKDEADGSPHDS